MKGSSAVSNAEVSAPGARVDCVAGWGLAVAFDEDWPNAQIEPKARRQQREILRINMGLRNLYISLDGRAIDRGSTEVTSQYRVPTTEKLQVPRCARDDNFDGAERVVPVTAGCEVRGGGF